MSTALHIIERAASKAGIRAAETPLTASEVEDGIDILNDLISQWNATSVLKGVDPVSNPEDELGEQSHESAAIKDTLAILIGNEYGKEPSPILIAAANRSESAMVTANLDLSKVALPSILPIGSGNHKYYTGRRFFDSEEDNF